MKKYLFSLIFLLVSYVGFSQKGLSYQAVILDPNKIEVPGQDISGQPLVNGDVWLKFSIYNGSTLQFEEVHKTKTDNYGLVNLLIGSVSSASFNSLVWDSSQKSLYVYASFDQGSSYTKISEQKLTYNPYALFAETAGKLGATLPISGGGTGATTAADARANLGLDQVNNTSDAAKPVSTATQTALNLKANASDVTSSLALKANTADMTAALALKANTADVNAGLALKANATDVTSALDLKANISDVNASLALKADTTYVLAKVAAATIADADANIKGKIKIAGDLGGTADAPTVPGLALKANTIDVNAALDLKANTVDMTNALASKANGATVATSLNLKENAANKSLNVSADGSSDIKYPSVKAVKTYVDAQLTAGVASATIADADANTKGKIQLGGDLGGTAAVPTVPGLALKANAADVTTLTTRVNANTASITANSSAIAAEAIRATAAELTLANNVTANTANITANSTAINSKAPLASPTFSGAVTAPIYASTPQALTDGSTISWDPSLGLNASVTLGGNRTLSFSTTPVAGAYGTLVVTQGTGGNFTLTLPSTTNKVLGSTSTTAIALSTAAGASDIINFYFDGANCYWNVGQGYGTAAVASSTNLATEVTGTLAVGNGGTGATTLTGLIKGNGTSAMTAATAGTDYLAPNGSAASLTNFPTLNQNTTGNAANVTGTVAVANGGTGLTTTPTNGQIDIGNGTGFTRAVLTAGSGISITNASGSITIASSGSSGIPYSGATGAVDLGAYDLTVNGLTVGKGKKDAGTAYMYNTALGVSALNSFTGGTKNTALGYNALSSVTSTDQNIAIGTYAMGSTVDYFQQSVAVGNQALQYNKGSFNTALGSNAISSSSLTSAATYLVAVGAVALSNNSSGQNNTAVGSYALSTNTTGNNNTGLGQGADVSSANLSNATAIGYNARVGSNNTIQLGNTSVTDVKTSGALTTGAVTYPIAHAGTSGQVLTSLGSGTLSWTTPSVAKPISDQIIATSAHAVATATFTLTQTPITNATVSPNVKPNVWMYINGIRTNNLAYSVSGTTVTYTAASNNSYTIVVGDRIQFDYAY